MELNALQDILPRKHGKRVGRGIGSGKGKTCGAGVKGQKARSGVGVNGFEGGQMPIHRRLPKRGFHNLGRVEYQAVNLSDLERLIKNGVLTEGAEVTRDVLVKAGVVRRSSKPVKILGKDALSCALILKVDAVSASAKEGIEKVGGKIELLQKTKIAASAA